MAWRTWWGGLGSGERGALLGGVVLILGIMAGAGFLLLRPSFETLFSDLAPEDAANIANQLALEGVEYRLDTKAGKVLVPKGQVHAARLRVMEQGLLLQQPVGFELFDDVEFGMTDFAQQINFQRALQGELTRTINALEEIEHARLHLVLPDASLFKRGAEEPKASLTVILKRGSQLSSERTRGIQRLIAAAVPGLRPEQVTIHDQRGVSLNAGSEEDLGAGAVSERIAAKQQYEALIRAKVQEVLDRAFGEGLAVASVDVSIDHERREVTREEPLPLAGTSTGAVTRMKTARVGKAAPTAIPDHPDIAPVQTSPGLSDITAEVDYHFGRQVERIQIGSGGIRRLTVGVLVPHGTPAELRSRMTELVASIVGLSHLRGDAIIVEENPLPASRPVPKVTAENPLPKAASKAIPDAEPVASQADSVRRLLSSEPLLAIGLSAAGILLFILLLLLARPRGSEPKVLSASERERLLKDLEAWLKPTSVASQESR